MESEMRREDRKLSDERSLEILKVASYGMLAINNAEGCGYAVPMSYAILGRSIYLHCAVDGKKLDLIRKDNRVSFCVVGEAEVVSKRFTMQYSSVMAFGRVYEVTDPTEKQTGLMALVHKYAADADEVDAGQRYAQASEDKTAVLRIEVEIITGKANE